MQINSCSRIIVGLVVLLLTAVAVHSDQFDTMRATWKNVITGGSSYDMSDATISARVTSITNQANYYWSSMQKTPSTYLWSDLASATDPSQINADYGRLLSMVRAYSTFGSSLYNNATLSADIKTGLDWVYANRYNENVVSYGNWWEWEIGAPIQLNQCAILLYDQLTAAQINNYMNAVDHFSPDPTKSAGITATAANRAWKAEVVAGRAIVARDTVKLQAAIDSLAPLYLYSTKGSDGFYLDGSFIQHAYFAYTGGYACNELDSLSRLLLVTNSTPYQVTSTNASIIYSWIYRSFAPVIYKGALMDMCRGRSISRSPNDHAVVIPIIASILRLTDVAPTADALAFRRMCKYWIIQDTYRNILSSLEIPEYVRAKAIMDDSSIAPMTEPVGSNMFSGMGRATHYRPGWCASLALSSARISSYEYLNNENLRGWYTGDGMLTVYTADLRQYSDQFWPTIDPYRMPGTTVNTAVRADGSGSAYLSDRTWAGGAILDAVANGASAGISCAAGIDYKSWDSTLTARKSWFMFDQEIVAMGAGINATCTNSTIETVVENRRLYYAPNTTTTSFSVTNSFIIAATNGSTVVSVSQPVAPGSAATVSAVLWVHMQGNTPTGSDIGYYFPNSTTIKTLRETRSGSWYDVNHGLGSTNIYSNTYLNMRIDHGAAPVDATYSYVVLPNKSATEVSSYATSPRVRVMTNCATVQAACNTALNIYGANLWVDTPVTINGLFMLDKRCSAMVAFGNTVKVTLSDPTQGNTGTVSATIYKLGTEVLSADPGVTDIQLSPNIKVTANVADKLGRSIQANIKAWNVAKMGGGLWGSDTYSNGVFTGSGSGEGIGGTADGCFYIYRSMSGDNTLCSTIISQNSAQAGILIRENVSTNAREVGLISNNGGGVNLIIRVSSTSAAIVSATVSATTPRYLKMERSGNIFTGYVSADGAAWTLVSSQSLALPSSVYYGFAISSRDNTQAQSASWTMTSP